MTPLLALTLTILTPTTPLATINHAAVAAPTTERSSTMAQGQGNAHTTSSPSHPIIRQGPPTTRARIGMDASNPTIPPPQRHGNTIVRDAPTTFTDTRTSR